MIKTRTKTTIKTIAENGLSIDSGFGKGKSLADIVCHLIRYSGLLQEPESIEKIKQSLVVKD